MMNMENRLVKPKPIMCTQTTKFDECYVTFVMCVKKEEDLAQPRRPVLTWC